jgi:putative oxidoreductase
MSKISLVTMLMRVVLGILFVVHGYSKFQMGLGNVAASFESAGTPGFLAYIAGPLELFGGIFLILGLFTRYVCVLFIIMLIGAFVTMKWSLGLLGNGQMTGYELDLAYLMVVVYLMVAGATKLSIDQFLFGRGKQS